MEQDPYPKANKDTAPSSSDSSSTLSVHDQMNDIEKQYQQENQEGTSTTTKVDQLNTEGQPTVQKVVTAQDWTGPDDPENPENWPAWKKAYTLVVVGIQCFVV